MYPLTLDSFALRRFVYYRPDLPKHKNISSLIAPAAVLSHLYYHCLLAITCHQKHATFRLSQTLPPFRLGKQAHHPHILASSSHHHRISVCLSSQFLAGLRVQLSVSDRLESSPHHHHQSLLLPFAFYSRFCVFALASPVVAVHSIRSHISIPPFILNLCVLIGASYPRRTTTRVPPHTTHHTLGVAALRASRDQARRVLALPPVQPRWSRPGFDGDGTRVDATAFACRGSSGPSGSSPSCRPSICPPFPIVPFPVPSHIPLYLSVARCARRQRSRISPPWAVAVAPRLFFVCVFLFKARVVGIQELGWSLLGFSSEACQCGRDSVPSRPQIPVSEVVLLSWHDPALPARYYRWVLRRLVPPCPRATFCVPPAGPCASSAVRAAVLRARPSEGGGGRHASCAKASDEPCRTCPRPGKR